jgi:hypothetical protein
MDLAWSGKVPLFLALLLANRVVANRLQISCNDLWRWHCAVEKQFIERYMEIWTVQTNFQLTVSTTVVYIICNAQTLSSAGPITALQATPLS